VSQSPGAAHRNAAYRPEIDGLRAVAVVGVILNHFSEGWLPGGYLGVDVFFVISGFVITASLARRPAEGMGDLMLGFYSRRVRRLLPALLLCVGITALLLTLVSYDPGQMLGVGWRSLFGFSNISLYRLAVDYFRPAAALNPFAHTWSLGVEEQFYLLFPLLIWFSGFARNGAAGSRRLVLLLLPLSVLSLVVFGQRLGVDFPAAYYLLPSRFWELGVGCLVFLLLQRRSPQGENIEAAASDDLEADQARWPLPPLPLLLGLGVLMAAPLDFGLLPVVSSVAITALLLGCLRPSTAAHGWLSTPPLVFVGLLSYSLYLWHWSVLSLSRWTIGVHPWTMPLQALLIVLLAYLSWRFVECPCRRTPWWPQRWRVVASGLALAALGTLGLQGLARKGPTLLYRGNPQSAEFSLAATPRGTDCSTPGHFRLLMVGDSHAHHFKAAADHLCGRYGMGYGESAVIGVPYPPVFYTNLTTGVNEEQAMAYAQAAEQRWQALAQEPGLPKGNQGVVVLSSRSPLYFDPGYLAEESLKRSQHFSPQTNEPVRREAALATWAEQVGRLADLHPQTRFVLFLPTPEFGSGVPMETCRPQWFRPVLPTDCQGVDRQGLDRFNAYLRQQLAGLLASHPNVVLYNPADALCPTKGPCPRRRHGYLLYSDGDHLSAYGAVTVLDDFVAFLHRQKGSQPAEFKHH
jgi:peptidoglycan/LPS O-acetylase OafA/YrhL